MLRLKGSTFRNYVKLLASDGRFDAVRAKLPPATQALFDQPPLASTWMDFVHVIRMVEVIEAQFGLGAVRDYSRRSINEMRGINTRIVEGMLRIFGASPATVFRRLNDSIRSLCEGMEYQYRPITERSGEMTSTYSVAVPDCILHGSVASLEEVLRICRAKGTVDGPKRLSPSSAKFVISWS